MTRTEAFVAALPYALVLAGLAAACLRAPETAWLPVIGAGVALIDPLRRAAPPRL